MSETGSVHSRHEVLAAEVKPCTWVSGCLSEKETNKYMCVYRARLHFIMCDIGHLDTKEMLCWHLRRDFSMSENENKIIYMIQYNPL